MGQEGRALTHILTPVTHRFPGFHAFSPPVSVRIQLMCGLGNQVVNGIFEARREELVARKPQPGDPR